MFGVVFVVSRFSFMGRYSVALFIFLVVAFALNYNSLAIAKKNTVPNNCRLDCEEQFRFIASIKPSATRDDFIRVFGREHRRVPYNSGESIHVFRAAFGIVISVFYKGSLEAVSVWPESGKNRITPVPGSHQTLSDLSYADLSKCGIRKMPKDLRIISDRLRGYAVSKACISSEGGFSRKVHVYSTDKCPFSETEILRGCPNSLKPDGVIMSSGRVKGRNYGSLGADVDYWIATCYGITVNC